jgi:TfoX/Sxy family transcriptional regulator of competence genes
MTIMAYDEILADRIRSIFKRRKGIAERKMFGGLAFLFNGNMCCGVMKDQLMLRLGQEGATEALALPHARPMDFTGKPMKGMVYVAPAGLASDEDLQGWVQRAVAFASTLPAKD